MYHSTRLSIHFELSIELSILEGSCDTLVIMMMLPPLLYTSGLHVRVMRTQLAQ